MHRKKEPTDFSFEIAFCEGILKQEASYSEVMEILAGYYTRAGRIDDGLALDQKLIHLQPDNATHHYNLACSLVLKDRKAEAVQVIRKAIEKGYDDFGWMLKDPDLRDLHAFPPFVELLREFEIRQE